MFNAHTRKSAFFAMLKTGNVRHPSLPAVPCHCPARGNLRAKVIIGGIGVPCPMRRPRIRNAIRPFPPPLSPAAFVFPHQGWLIVRPRTVARSTHSIQIGAWV